MHLIVVWTADIDEVPVLNPDGTPQTNDDGTPKVTTVRINSKRCAIDLENISYAEERSISSGEVYVYAIMATGYVVYLFEVTLDSLRELSKQQVNTVQMNGSVKIEIQPSGT
jgi:hypothetical protein